MNKYLISSSYEEIKNLLEYHFNNLEEFLIDTYKSLFCGLCNPWFWKKKENVLIIDEMYFKRYN